MFLIFKVLNTITTKKFVQIKYKRKKKRVNQKYWVENDNLSS